MKCNPILLLLLICFLSSCTSEKKEPVSNKKIVSSVALPIKGKEKKQINLLNKLKLIKGNTDYRIATVNGFRDAKEFDLKGFGTFYIRGWAIDKPANTVAGGVVIQIGSKTYKAKYGMPKPGVATKYNNKELINSEFECRIPMKEIGKGKHTFSIKILSKDKKSYYSSGKREMIVS